MSYVASLYQLWFFFSCGSRSTLEQVEIVSIIFVRNVDKIFCFVAYILDSRCEYDLRTRALLSRHVCTRYDVAHPTPRGGERLDFVDEKTQRMKSSVLTLLSSYNNIKH